MTIPSNATVVGLFPLEGGTPANVTNSTINFKNNIYKNTVRDSDFYESYDEFIKDYEKYMQDEDKKAKEISDRLQGGTTVKCDDGFIFLSQDQPWTPLVDEADSSIVRRYTVITMQFITI